MFPAPLIATKLHKPGVPAALVGRKALHGLLQQSLSRPLTLISAPAGFGKTTLVMGWLQSLSVLPQIAWLSLDEGDDNAILFWRYCIAALQRIQAGLAATAAAMLASPSAPEMSTILAALINDLACFPDEMVFIIDDYQMISSPAIHDGVRFLLEHLPSNIHLVLLTREDPPLGLARLGKTTDGMACLNGQQTELVLLSALALACLPTVQLAFANPLMPAVVSLGHFWEVAISTGIYGAICALVLPQAVNARR